MEEKMEDEMFLKPGYLKTLRLLVEWEDPVSAGHRRGESTSTAFVLRIRYYEGEDAYHQEVFVKPDRQGIFLLCCLSNEYDNVRVVPQIVTGIVEKEKTNDELTILQLPMKVDDVDLVDVKNGKNERISFGFWAVKYIPFKAINPQLFRDRLRNFAIRADKVKDEFSSAYTRC